MSVPVVAARRSPFCAADGVLAGWHPVDLAAVVMREAIAAADLGDDEVDLVVAGCAEPVGAQGANVAQACVLAAGWRSAIPSLVVDAAAVSGFASLAAAADAVAQGRARTAVVVGVSSASIVRPGASALGRQYGRPWGDSVATRYADAGGLLPPVVAADRVALARGIDRPRQDAWGRASHARRPARVDGLVEVGARPGASVAVQRGTPVTADVLRSSPPVDLEPIFEPEGSTTAAGFAPAADGVTVLVLSTRGSRPLGELLDVRIGAGDPIDPLAGIGVATGLSVDGWSVAEPSASTVLLVLEALGLEESAVNVDGGTIAVGDAGAAEDLRLVADAMHGATSGDTGAALRVGTGAAALSHWQRF